jgi:hypothetical protein
MAQGEFTKEECDSTEGAVKEIFTTLSKNKQGGRASASRLPDERKRSGDRR